MLHSSLLLAVVLAGTPDAGRPQGISARRDGIEFHVQRWGSAFEKADVLSALDGQRDAFVKCRREATQRVTGLEGGGMAVRVDVSQLGIVTRTETTDDDVGGDQELIRCVEAAIRGTRFPGPSSEKAAFFLTVGFQHPAFLPDESMNIEVHVADTSGTPVANVHVIAWEWSRGGFPRDPLDVLGPSTPQTAVTAEDGIARISVPVVHDYVVGIVERDAFSAKTLLLSATGTPRVDLPYLPATDMKIVLVDERGRRLEPKSADVTFLPVDANDTLAHLCPLEPEPRARTVGAGTYQLALPYGRYRVRVFVPGGLRGERIVAASGQGAQTVQIVVDGDGFNPKNTPASEDASRCQLSPLAECVIREAPASWIF